MAKDYKNAIIFNLFVIVMCFAKLQGVSMKCNESQWTCDYGACISAQLRCNGAVDCADGSDETAENCIHSYNTCLKNAFRCSYGACIPSTLICDGVANCADKSDEMNCCKDGPNCQIFERLRGQCGPDKAQCVKTKECIATEQLCDGMRDCSDGSDETVEVCGALDCPPIGFHCGYGACVDMTAKCNGTIECVDGSDEAWELCGTPRKTLKAVQSTPT